MKKFVLKIRYLSAALISVFLISCSNQNSETVQNNVSQQIDAILENEGELLTGELENKTIRFLSTWDINPDSTGKSIPLELAIFQQKYGGNVETKIVSWNERYEQLAYAINGGEGIDFFPAGDFDAFPKGAVKDMFVPVDDYIDFSSPLWKDVKYANDLFIWNDNHYIICTEVTSDCVIIYNRSKIDELGLDDPAELYAAGNWNWNTFRDMLASFCNEDDMKYGIDGWYFEAAVSATTGIPYLEVGNGTVFNNMKNPDIERVQNYMYDLYKSGYVFDKSQFQWKEHPEFIGMGKEIFYPCGLWKIYTRKSTWADIFGEDMFFVPMPKDPESDNYYTAAGINGYFIVKNAPNPEGVVKFAECKRFSMLNKSIEEIAEKQFIRDYEWTDEMIQMKKEAERLANENPVFDFYAGVSNDTEMIIDSNEYGIRASMNGIPWSQTLEAAYDTINNLIEDALKK